MGRRAARQLLKRKETDDRKPSRQHAHHDAYGESGYPHRGAIRIRRVILVIDFAWNKAHCAAGTSQRRARYAYLRA